MTRQVSRMQGQTPNGEMGAIGSVIAAGVALLLLPVLPFVAVLWLLRKLGGGENRGRPRPS
jgi:UPF0716 family protein affecting phage T7 exclusion